jgi:hypothetical protein
MEERRLVSVRRTVPVAEADRYLEAWERLAGLVRGMGAHAWGFRSVEDEALRIEFLEFRAGADPRAEAAVREAAEALEKISRGRAEEWVGG